MGDEERETWQKWQVWDRLRYERDKVIRADVLEDVRVSTKDETK